MEKEDFALACVVLPANEIPAVGIKLAEAGKHFFVEKQFARTAADLARLVDAVERNQVRVLAGYPWRFHPVMQDLKQFIDQGVFGAPLSLESRLVTTQVRPGSRDPSHFMYGKDTEGGGVLHMLGGHYIELMRHLMQCEVKTVQALVGRPVGHIDEPLEDVAVVALEYENGALGSLHAAYALPPLLLVDMTRALSIAAYTVGRTGCLLAGHIWRCPVKRRRGRVRPRSRLRIHQRRWQSTAGIVGSLRSCGNSWRMSAPTNPPL